MKRALINAKIYQEKDHFAQALLIENNIIQAVGTNEDITALKPDEVIDCQGNTLIPGLNDSHSHLLMVTELRQQLQLLDSFSIADILARGRAFLKHRPELTALLGMGWNPASFSEGEMRNLTRHDLDQISTDIPVLLTRACGHMIVTNTRALELAGVTSETKQIPGGLFEIDDDGPNGRFFENARELVLHLQPTMSPPEMQEALKETMKYALSKGITTVQTNDIGLVRPLEEALAIYRSLYASDAPSIKTVHQMCFDTPEAWEEFLNTTYHEELPEKMSWGPLKLFKDGSLGGRSALVNEAYQDAPGNFGLDVTPNEKAKRYIDIAKRYGRQVYTHCIGDKAMEEMLEAYQPLTKNDRWGLVHCQITHPETLKTMADSGAIGVIQPIFLRSDITALQGAISPALQASSYAWKTMLDLAIPIAVGTDSPVEDLDPFINLYTALKRRDPKGSSDSFYPEEELTIEQVIDGYTLGSAYAEFKEDTKGRLKPGYVADMVLLDRDIFTISPEDILNTKVLQTWVDGEILFQSDNFSL